MGLMNDARKKLRTRIEAAQPGDRVASVRTFSAAMGGLSTASTVAVLQDAIDDGWIFSTRGPNGGYWRTEKPVRIGLDEAVEELVTNLQAALGSAQTVRSILDDQPQTHGRTEGTMS